jgi:DNA invertase Pin-like site-specific DNA recombinase
MRKRAMTDAVIYARVSSKEQEREGYSIEAQLRLLREYSKNNGFEVLHEFVEVETAKRTGRPVFKEMLVFIEATEGCDTILVEKTDRLYRNLKDWITIDDLGLHVHLVKEGRIIGPSARSDDKFVHGINVLMAKRYIDNLGEEAAKGMREKVLNGGWPHLAPFGYRNVKELHSVEPEPSEAKAVRWLFSRFGGGDIAVEGLRREFHGAGFTYRSRSGRIGKSTLYKLLRNPFYKGIMPWNGGLYPGKYEALVEESTWQRVQALLDSHLKPKNTKHDFPYRGVLTCGHCGCVITAEIKKDRYVYYHCTNGRGKCDNKWVNESELEKVFTEALIAIQIDPELADWIADGIKELHHAEIRQREEEVERLKKRAKRLQDKIQSAYNDKLEEKIDEDFWREQHNRMMNERDKALGRIRAFHNANKAFYEAAEDILKLASNVGTLLDEFDTAQKRNLFNLVLSNCTLTSGIPHYSYKKPFDILVKGALKQNWLGS